MMGCGSMASQWPSPSLESGGTDFVKDVTPRRLKVSWVRFFKISKLPKYFRIASKPHQQGKLHPGVTHAREGERHWDAFELRRTDNLMVCGFIVWVALSTARAKR
jgi:hypothetical protein